MVKEQIAGGGRVEDFSDKIDRNETETYMEIMKSTIDNDSTGIFRTLYNKSMTAQYHKAVMLHFHGVDLQEISFEFVRDDTDAGS